MTCLWLTLADPDPATNGQYLYSSGLIRALAGTGASITVLGLSRPDSTPRHNSRALSWHLAEVTPVSKWAGLASRLPQIALRSRTRGLQQLVMGSLAKGRWETIVFDSISVGWALDAVLRYGERHPRRPTLVYLSHNHERTVADHIARHDPVWTTRQMKRFDAGKVAWLERRLVQAADLVTANTPEDAERFAAERPGRAVSLLLPGYDGPRVRQRQIHSDLPRRAVVVGSFDWLPKRISLEAFLDQAAPVFAAAGIELQIVGQAETGYLDGLRSRYPSVDFTGRVEDVRPYMAKARMALVPDQLGGFKLKGLDYVFNRLPVLAMAGALPGMPLKDGESIRYADSHAALTQLAATLMDDVVALEAQQQAAYTACAAQFDWPAIGRRLAIDIAVSRRPFLAAARRNQPRENYSRPVQRAG